jgi:hypothetical protein
MIINNSEVQGIYIYNEDSRNIEFTKNDLVVSGDCIYVCNRDVVSGIDPAEDTSNEYYTPYPGSKISTASEFFQYIENGSREFDNKYISTQAIKGILQGYQFGLDLEGVITDYIDKNGDTTLVLSTPTDRPLDNLMFTETLNRGMIKVSHELDQIVDGEVDGIKFSTVFGFLEKEDSETGEPIDYQLILSQYTYKSSDTLYVRIQELTSPLTGVSVYRYMSWNEGEFPSGGNVISGWRNVFSYSSAIQSKLNALQDFYNNLAKQQKARVEALEGSFRFKERWTGGNSVDNLENGIYTVCLTGISSSSSLPVSESVVLSLGGSGYDMYFNSLSGYLSVTVSGGKHKIELKESSASIISVYSREVKRRV